MPWSIIRPLPAPPTRHDLRLAMWFGLATGLAEVAMWGIRKYYLGRTIRFGPALVWMAPLADVAAFLVIGLGVAAIQRASRRRFPALSSPGFAVAVFGFFSALSVLLMYRPLYLYAKLLLAAGVGVQASRIAGRRPAAFGRLARISYAPMVLVILVASIAVGWKSSADLGRGSVPPAPAGERPNVLLIVLDTVRAKNMSLYGYDRPTTPHLERWAKTGVVFDRATSTSPWTLPSHAGMFTGRWPHELSSTLEQPVDDTHPTLAEALQGAGYLTAGFVANTQYCGYEFGLSRGFAHYEDYTISARELLIASTLVREIANSRLVRQAIGYYDNIPRKNAAAITNDFLTWLPNAEGRPFFAFLNYFDAHEVYLPPARFADAFGPEAPRGNERVVQDIRRGLRNDWNLRPATDIKAEVDMYDGAIAYLDFELDRLFAELRSRGVLDSTLVIVTSDHGEQFGEHGLFLHGNSLYEPLLHVPLIAWYPKLIPGGSRVSSRVSLRDIPATVLSLAGLANTSGFPGQSLSRFWNSSDGTRPDERPVLSEVSQADWGKEWYPVARGDMASLMDDRYHYIRNGDGREELYALDAAPAERRDLMLDPNARGVIERFRTQLKAAAGGKF